MIYGQGLGNKTQVIVGSNLDYEVFAGDGVTTEFTLTNTTGRPNQVDVGGQLLTPGDFFTISGNSVTLTFAPDVGQDVVVYYATNISVITDPLSRVNVSTALSPISFDMDNKKQRAFKGSAPIGSAMTWQWLRYASMVQGSFHFTMSSTDIQTLPAFVKMNDGSWNSGAKTWTPAATGDYVATWNFDGTTLHLVISGPNI